jgi:hypothetical protein
MNMRLRRYFPLFGAVAFIAVCVFLGRSDELASYAGGAGCSGSAGVEQDLSALGTADDQSRESVRELANFPIVASEAERIDDAAAIGRLEDALARDVIGVAPAAAELFQEAGCFSPGSARIADLISRIGTHNSISPTQRSVFVRVLLDTAIFSAAKAPAPNFELKQNNIPGSRLQFNPEIVANDRLVPTFEKIRAAISENNGAAAGDSIQEIAEAEAPQLNTEKLGAFNQKTCTLRSFEAVAAIVKLQVEAPEKTAYRLLDALDVLEPMNKGAYKLVEALGSVAPVIQPWDGHFVAIAMNKNFDDHTRGLACKNAATRGNDLSAIRKIAADTLLPAQISDCLLTYQKEGSSDQADIGAGVASINFDNQIDVIRNTSLTVNQSNAITNLQNLFDPTRLTYFSSIGTLQGLDNARSLRQELARVDLVAQEYTLLPLEGRTSFMDELGRLEQVSPNHASIAHQFRSFMARRTGAQITGEDVDNLKRQDAPQTVDSPNGDKRGIDLKKAAEEIRQNNTGTGLNTMNPVAKPKEDDSAELKNGKPVPLPNLGQ